MQILDYGGAVALLRALGNLLFPPACQVCRRLGTFPLCDDCRRGFRPIRPPVCQKCGEPLDGAADLVSTCVRCRRRRLYFRVARAAGIYDGTLREAIHALKFAGRQALAGPLGDILTGAALAVDEFRGADVIVPVPLHPRRLRERGFNQAELLARPVAAVLARPVERGLLARTRPTVPQSALPADNRQANVRDAFEAVGSTNGARILLVDDVMSTGFTAAECARALRRAGASEVLVLTLARAVYGGPTDSQ